MGQTGAGCVPFPFGASAGDVVLLLFELLTVLFGACFSFVARDFFRLALVDASLVASLAPRSARWRTTRWVPASVEATPPGRKQRFGATPTARAADSCRVGRG